MSNMMEVNSFPVELVDDTAEFFAPVSSDLIDELIGQYRKMRQNIEQVSDFFAGDMGGALNYFVKGNKETGVRMMSVENLFKAENAVAALNSAYWSKALNLTDVYNAMPQKRRDEWNKSITDMTAPEFTEESVRPTISGLLASRQKFFAERVDGIFRSLSGDHVTNSPSGFNKRMIIAYVMSQFDYPDSSRCGIINDLRTVIAKFMGRGEPRWNSTSSIVREARKNHGQWMILDGGALRIRVYMKGTAHLEVHPDIAYRLNQVLSFLYPMAIASEFRTKPIKKHKEFQMMGRPLPFEVLDVISDLVIERNSNNCRLPRSCWDNKVLREEVTRVLASIGGVLHENYHIYFDYDPIEAFAEIINSGCIPDQKSHQFYQSSKTIALTVVDMADIKPTDTFLEPSAGQGGIAMYLPKERTTCVEISALHCDILKARGFNVVKADFIEWAKTAGKYSVVCMNPPFSQGRAQQHVEVAAGLVAQGGRLVAVMPSSFAGKNVLPGWNQKWSRVFSGEFLGTSVAVVILAATRC